MKLLVIISAALMIAEVFGQYGTCDRGSDAKCMQFGPEYCCAYVDIKSDKDQLKGYWCANMQYTGEKYDEEGYSGSVICSGARYLLGVVGMIGIIAQFI